MEEKKKRAKVQRSVAQGECSPVSVFQPRILLPCIASRLPRILESSPSFGAYIYTKDGRNPRKQNSRGCRPSQERRRFIRRSSPAASASNALAPNKERKRWVESGVNRHSQRIDVLFLKAVWGGITLSYGGMLEAVVGGSMSAMTNNAGLLRLVEGLVFPVGLTM